MLLIARIKENWHHFSSQLNIMLLNILDFPLAVLLEQMKEPYDNIYRKTVAGLFVTGFQVAHRIQL